MQTDLKLQQAIYFWSKGRKGENKRIVSLLFISHSNGQVALFWLHGDGSNVT